MDLPAAGASAPTPPPTMPDAGALGRFGFYSVHLMGGRLWLYDRSPHATAAGRQTVEQASLTHAAQCVRLPAGARVSFLVGECINPPPRYRRLAAVERAIREARETLAARLAMMGGAA